MGLDEIIKQVFSLRVTPKSLQNPAQAEKIHAAIKAIETTIGFKADSIAFIVNGRGRRVEASLLESAFTKMLPDDPTLLKKLLEKMDEIDALTKCVQRSVYLALLHTAIYRKIGKPVPPKVDPNILFLSDLNDHCRIFLQSLHKQTINKLKQAGVYETFEAFCQRDASEDIIVGETKEKKAARLKVSYYKKLDEIANNQAKADPQFNVIRQQHRVVYQLQNILFDNHVSTIERCVAFDAYLKNNLEIITRSADSAALRFLKGVTVLLATIITLPLFGIGGYLAYNGLFGTPGKKFVGQTKKVQEPHEFHEFADLDRPLTAKLNH
ncbi:MAG: hypothetical protein P4M14_03705 [Gammaproteobacteria bacterium]|nr:hypothetical protein [Gammaproteobacteria bacterium]